MVEIQLKRSDEEYFRKCTEEYKFSYGLIIGQRLNNQKYSIVHVARNCEEDTDTTDTYDLPPGPTTNVTNIDHHALANQCISAAKMISGSFIVLGMFICSEKEIEEKSSKTIAKKFFNSKCFMAQNKTYSKTDENENINNILLLYTAAEQKVVSMIYSKRENSFTVANCLIEEPNFEWIMFETSYELDEVFPIKNSVKKINLEHQLKETLESIKDNLIASEIFIQNEYIEESLQLESYIKEKFGSQDFEKKFKAFIFLPVVNSNIDDSNEVKAFNGTIRLSGAISSRVWCRKENTIKDVKNFIRADVIRSLDARIQMYCDGLTDPNANFDTTVINEPPRRIYFTSPKEKIQFSEYIFRGETPTVAVAQAKQVLDLDIDSSSIYDDLEGLPDDDTFTISSSDTQVRLSTATSLQLQITRSMYLLGTVVALFVLIVSILLHFTMG